MDEKDAALAQDLTTSAGLQAEVLLAELATWLQQVFCLPGEYALTRALEYAPLMFRFIGIPEEGGGMLGASLAAVIWLGSVLLLLTAYRLTSDLYITITGYANRARQRWLRVGRNAARRTGIAARTAVRKRTDRPIEPTISEEVELGELEYAVLRCHGELGPGIGLTAADVAEALDVRISQIRKALQVLLMLQLIKGVSGVPGQANGTYRLTPHGEGFLAACSAVAAAPVAA